MKVLAELALLLVVGVLLVGCGSTERSTAIGDPAAHPMDGRTYVVTGVTQGGEPRDLVRGTEVRFAFDVDSLTINAGCNTLSGSYSYTGNRLTVTDLAGTDMGCEQALMDQDAWLAGLFAKPVQLATGDDAALISGDVVLALAGREVVHPDRPLAGTRWVLDGVVRGTTSSSVPSGAQAWFEIDGDTVHLDAGCTGGSGRVVQDGSSLRFSDVVFEARPCPADDVVLPAFSAVIDGEARFAVTEDALSITKGSRGLTFRAR